MSSDWDEIQRLAADLQRAQLSGSIQKLSERNCIEIVSRLVQTNLIEVIYTADGKEYLIPQQLQREIRDELYVARGRVSLVDLAQILNVDFSHVETQAKLLAKQDSRVDLVLGQLVDASYMDTICEQINESLQVSGTVSISNITKDYDLPSEFVQEEVSKRLGSIIEGFRDEQDPRIILTPTYVMRNKAKIRGALSAITMPTSVADIVNRYKIQEHLFFSLAEELLKTNRIAGTISGGKKANKATFNPQVYSKAQVKWIDDFMAQNGYLEYDAVARLGLSEPKAFIKKRFEDLHFLSSCCVGPQIFSAIESSVDEAISSNTWLDVMTLLPTVLSPEDGNILLQAVLKERPRAKVDIYAQTVMLSQDLVQKLQASIEELMAEQAKKDLESKKFEKVLSGSTAAGDKFGVEGEKVDKKEERRKKAAAGKAGGGAQGRETKTKSSKKKGGKKRDEDWGDDSDEDMETTSKGKKKQQQQQDTGSKIEFLSPSQLEAKLSEASSLVDCPDELFSELSDKLYPVISKSYKDLLTELHQSTVAASMQGKRKSHSQLQEKCNSVVSHVRLLEKGLGCFEGQERGNLEKHVLKTLCTDLVNSLFSYFVEEGQSDPVNADQRLKVLRGVAADEAAALHDIHKALAGDEVSAFLDAFEENVSKACDLFIKKSDKKKDRQLMFNHRHTLIEQLTGCDEPALCLHLASMILFQTHFNAMIHASGKFVPQIIAKVCTSVGEEEAQLLKEFQEKVISLVAEKDQEAKAKLQGDIEQQMPKLKEIAVSKKSGKAED